MKYTNYEVFCSVIFTSLYCLYNALTLSILYTALNWPSSLKVTAPVLHSYKQWGTALLFYMNQRQYSPDMAPCDFSFFPQFKNALKCKQFENVEMIKLNAMQQILEIPKQIMRSSSSGRTRGICAAKQDGHSSRRISPFKSRFSIVSFTVWIWILHHLASHTHTHTHIWYKIPREGKSWNKCKSMQFSPLWNT